MLGGAVGAFGRPGGGGARTIRARVLPIKNTRPETGPGGKRAPLNPALRALDLISPKGCQTGWRRPLCGRLLSSGATVP
jgi:hypothetical protein